MSNLLTIVQDGQAVTTSRQVAENFGKEHKNILRDIDIIISRSELSREMFLESTYENHGVEIGKISEPRFGRVNTYHTDVLKEVFA